MLDKDLAMLFSVSQSTTMRWADSGKLWGFKTVGHHRRFTVEEVLKFIARYHLDLSLNTDAIKE